MLYDESLKEFKEAVAAAVKATEELNELLASLKNEECYDGMLEELEDAFPLLAQKTKDPCGKEDREDEVGQLIIHLNDDCGWTREEIAEWVDTLD